MKTLIEKIPSAFPFPVSLALDDQMVVFFSLSRDWLPPLALRGANFGFSTRTRACPACRFPPQLLVSWIVGDLDPFQVPKHGIKQGFSGTNSGNFSSDPRRDRRAACLHSRLGRRTNSQDSKSCPETKQGSGGGWWYFGLLSNFFFFSFSRPPRWPRTTPVREIKYWGLASVHFSIFFQVVPNYLDRRRCSEAAGHAPLGPQVESGWARFLSSTSTAHPLTKFPTNYNQNYFLTSTTK